MEVTLHTARPITFSSCGCKGSPQHHWTRSTWHFKCGHRLTSHNSHMNVDRHILSRKTHLQVRQILMACACFPHVCFKPRQPTTVADMDLALSLPSIHARTFAWSDTQISPPITKPLRSNFQTVQLKKVHNSNYELINVKRPRLHRGQASTKVKMHQRKVDPNQNIRNQCSPKSRTAEVFST